MAVTLEYSTPPAAVNAAGEFTSRAAAEAYTAGVCFTLGPPTLIGAELEWLTTDQRAQRAQSRPTLAALVAALGDYAPTAVAPGSPAVVLPGGSRVTLEPGGQVELSSAAVAGAGELCTRLAADTRRLRDLLGSQQIAMVSAAADAERRARRILRLPRYQAMERYLGGIGPFGRLMMCNTAATQISVDAGNDAGEVAARWQALYAMGPALLAAFARSPVLHGAPAGQWVSQRMRTWLRLDQARTRPPVDTWPDPVAGYARWAIDAPLLCVRAAGAPGASWQAPPGATFGDWLSGALDEEAGRRPNQGDLDYHLTTMFPPVRAAGHLEIRYLDAQPDDAWGVPIRMIDALMSDPVVVAEATALAAPVADRWLDAARTGLTDPELRRTAAELLDLAATHAPDPEAVSILGGTARRCRLGAGPDEYPPRRQPQSCRINPGRYEADQADLVCE